jgi:hypothetical protein
MIKSVATREGGWTLLDKGAHALLLVAVRKAKPENFRAVRDGEIGIGILSGVNGFLAITDCHGAAERDSLRRRDRGLQ